MWSNESDNDYPLEKVGEEIHAEGHTGKYRNSVMKRYGKEGFDKKGRILQSVINTDEKSYDPTIRKEAILAKTYHNVQVGNKSFKI